jgi:hypothetical protein
VIRSTTNLSICWITNDCRYVKESSKWQNNHHIYWYQWIHLPATPLRRSPGGVILLILRNRVGINGDNGGESLSLSSRCRSENSTEFKQPLRSDLFVTSAEKSVKRFFAQFSVAFEDFPVEPLLSVKLRAFPNESVSLKHSGVPGMPCHSSRWVLFPGLGIKRNYAFSTKIIRNKNWAWIWRGTSVVPTPDPVFYSGI